MSTNRLKCLGFSGFAVNFCIVKQTTTTAKGEFEKLRVQFISLVKHPANRRDVLYKSADDVINLPLRIIKRMASPADATKKYLYGVVYEPGVTDTQGDSASAEVIKDAAYEFLKMGLVNMVDEQHNFEPGKGKIVESFILRSDDPNFVGVQKGAWCVVIELSPEMEAKIDEIGGLSLAGQGFYKAANEEDAAPVPQIRYDGMKKAHVRKARPGMRTSTATTSPTNKAHLRITD